MPNEEKPQLVGDTAFRSISYIPSQQAVYYLRGDNLTKQTSTQIQSIGEISFDDYSMIFYVSKMDQYYTVQPI